MCHRVNFVLFSDVLVTDNSIDGGFNGREILVFVLVQGVCLGDGLVNLAVIRVFVFQCGYRVFDSLCHRVNSVLFLKGLLATVDGVDSGINSGEILVIVPVQRVCLGDGLVNRAVIRGFDRQRGKITVLHKYLAQQRCHSSVLKFFCCLWSGASHVIFRSTFSIEAVCVLDRSILAR